MERTFIKVFLLCTRDFTYNVSRALEALLSKEKQTNVKSVMDVKLLDFGEILEVMTETHFTSQKNLHTLTFFKNFDCRGN